MDKSHTLAEAAALVGAEGARMAFGGVTMYRRPLAFALSLIERFLREGEPTKLVLSSFTSGLEGDLLVAHGMVATVRTCYFGLEAFGLAPHFTEAAGRGSIRIMEESEASLVAGLRASLAGVGFMPSLAWLGTDLPALRPDVKTIADPYSGEELIAFPAIDLDVAIIHALQADPEGNAIIGGNQGVDFELALVADTVIITAEEIVPRLERADIVAPVVDAVVHTEKGAWPTSCHPLYPLDGNAVLDYLERITPEGRTELVKAWFQRHQISPSEP